MVSLFRRAPLKLSMIFNQNVNVIDRNWGHLLQTVNQGLSSVRIGETLENMGGFLDGTVRSIYRPKFQQCIFYNRHRRSHAFKFQFITTPSRMIASLYGPVQRRG